MIQFIEELIEKKMAKFSETKKKGGSKAKTKEARKRSGKLLSVGKI